MTQQTGDREFLGELATLANLRVGPDSATPPSWADLYVKRNANGATGGAFRNLDTGVNASASHQMAADVANMDITAFSSTATADTAGISRAGAVSIQSNATRMFIANSGAAPIHLVTSDLERMRIDGAGLISVGDTHAGNIADLGCRKTKSGSNLIWQAENLGAATGSNASMQVFSTGGDSYFQSSISNSGNKISSFGVARALNNDFVLAMGADLVGLTAMRVARASPYGMTLTGGLGVFNTTAPTSKPAVTGVRDANPALANLLTTIAATGLITDSTTAGSGGGGSPGGANMHVQYNNSGAFGGDSAFQWNSASTRLSIGGPSADATLHVERPTAQTSTQAVVANLKHTTTGDMSDGFGPSLTFSAEDSAAVENLLATIETSRVPIADNWGRMDFILNQGGTPLTVLRLSPLGGVVVGPGSLTTNAALDVQSTTGAFIPPRMTGSERNALTPTNGMQIYNTSGNRFQGYQNGGWINLDDGSSA